MTLSSKFYNFVQKCIKKREKSANVIARAFVITILCDVIMTFHFVARAMIYELIHLDVWFRA